jgi:putative N6-adenine-specific DNA methylase
VEIIVKTFQGLEEILEQELIKLGINQTRISKRAVICEASWEQIYKSNYWLRTATRILLPIHKFVARNPNDLYNRVISVNWDEYLDPEMDFRIDSTVKSNYFTHSKFAALKTKDAIADFFRNKYDKRPNVNTEDPDLRIHLHINDENCTLSLDSSGDSLHKRGYRDRSVKAPINEVLAAGLVLLSGWDKSQKFMDPMCGSGTIPIEAALIALNRPPQQTNRWFGFMRWKNYNPRLWEKIKDQANFEIKNEIPHIIGCDIEAQALKSAHANIKTAGLENFIELKKIDFFEDQDVYENVFLIMNPPYDERLEIDNDIRFYKSIGNQLKHRFKNAEAWIFSGNPDALKYVGLKTSKRLHLYNGPLASKFHKFEMYEGSKKA